MSLPGPGAGVPVGALGRVQGPGTRRCLHQVAFEDGPGWVLPLPSRHVELL